MLSSSNKVILTNPLLVLMVLEEAIEGYVIGVEVADGFLKFRLFQVSFLCCVSDRLC